MKPLISIVILNYNGLRYLEPCLSSLATQSYEPFEIILVDNGSSDGSANYARTHFPGVILVENGTNCGFAGGANTGIRKARGGVKMFISLVRWRLVSFGFSDDRILSDAESKDYLQGRIFQFHSYQNL